MKRSPARNLHRHDDPSTRPPPASLQVLLTLSQQHTAALAGYAAFLTNILDYVDGYTDAQVHQVCG